MPQGLETYDASGNLITSVGDSLPRRGGNFQTNSVDGSITNGLIGSVPASRVWWFVRDISGYTYTAAGSPPQMSVSGSTLSWVYPFAFKPNCLITWGVF